MTKHASRAAGRPVLGMLFPHLILGGGETAMMEVADGLQREFDLRVCVLNRRKITVERTIEEELRQRFQQVTIIPTPEELESFLQNVDVLLWYGTNRWTPTALEALLERPRSIRVVHTDKSEEGPLFAKRWSGCIDAVTCVSPAVQRLIPGSVFIPNTTSPSNLQGPKRELFPLAERVRPTLGFLGRLWPFKNVEWLILNALKANYNLAIQGLDTEELTRKGLEDLAEQYGMAERITFLTPSRDVGTLLKSVDALVLLSRNEGFPMVVIEAGFVGTPVIATPVGALPEVFADEILFVDLKDGEPSGEGFRLALSRLGPQWGRRLNNSLNALCAKESVVARYVALIESVWANRPADLSRRKLVKWES